MSADPIVSEVSASRWRAVAAAATTLDERAAWLARAGGARTTPAGTAEKAARASDAGQTSAPGDDPDAILRAWNQAFSPGDPEAFRRRLAWDGLDADRARAIVLARPTDVGDWTMWMDRIVACAADVARALDEGSARDLSPRPSDTELPFAELWLPISRAAEAVLSSGPRGDRWRQATATVRGSFAHQLMSDVARFAAPAVYQAFDAQPRSRGAYRAFVARMLAGDLAACFAAHPVLARQVATIAARWVETTGECLERVHVDDTAIADRFAAGRRPGPLVDVQPALSDPHHGRRRVMALTFASGLRLIYKPRSLRLDVAFADFVSWAERHGLVPAPRVAATLDRGDYGWVEAVDPRPCRSQDDVRRYFRSAGSVLCLAHALRARDLHMENVVATPDGPVLVDLELFLQPVSRSAEEFLTAVGPTASRDLVEESCLATGFVRLVESGPDGEMYDAGGLCGDGRGPRSRPRRVWTDLRSDEITFALEETFDTSTPNRVILDGVRQAPEAYVDEIRSGFEGTYRFLLSQRAALLGPDGPLARFDGCSTRVIARPTNQYAMLTDVLAAPRYQRDGASRSAAVDVLSRGHRRSIARPATWDVIAEERRVLDELDVPCFSVRCGDTAVFNGARRVADRYFVRSGLDAARARLDAWSEDDLRAQLTLLTRALSESPSTPRVPPPAGLRPDEAHDPAWLIAHAGWVAETMLVRAVRTGDRLTWPHMPGAQMPASWRPFHLYDGCAGIGFFLGALAHVTGQARWADAADAVMQSLLSRIHSSDRHDTDEGGGICNGWGSIVYSLVWLGRWLEQPRYLSAARAIVDRLAWPIDADDSFDVAGGSAGAILALLAFDRAASDPRAIEMASRFAEHLIGRRDRPDHGAAWTSGGRQYVGYAHGAAGIADALLRLFKRTGESSCLETARGALAFVQRTFRPELGNWPIAASAEGAGSAMVAWCHGAAGMALACGFALDVMPDPALETVTRAALVTTARDGSQATDHLCCGRLGRVEALLTVGRHLGSAEAVEAAYGILANVVDDARRRGHFSPSGSAFEYRVSDPGFFRGLSGMGYTLLRAAAPDRMPCVLRFEASVEPGGSGARA